MSELEFIYRVAFNEPPLENDDSWEFYFTSLSAIYEKFTPEQVGCKVSRLWNLKITPDKPYNGRRVINRVHNYTTVVREKSGENRHISCERFV